MELLKIKDKYCSLIEVDDFDYPKFNPFAIVHHSNSIEGSTLTKEETYLLLEEHLTPKNKLLKIQEKDFRFYFSETKRTKKN